MKIDRPLFILKKFESEIANCACQKRLRLQTEG